MRVKKSDPSKGKKIVLTVLVLPFSLLVLFVVGFVVGLVLAVIKADVEMIAGHPLFNFGSTVLWFGVITLSLWWIWGNKNGKSSLT